MLVIAPAVPERPVKFVAVGGVNTMRFGVLKFARSRILRVRRGIVARANVESLFYTCNRVCAPAAHMVYARSRWKGAPHSPQCRKQRRS